MKATSRTILKRKYEQFCEAWKNEKTYQRIAEMTGQELGEGVQKLGKKPTFSMWLAAYKTGAFNPKQEEKAVEVQDTSWEE